MSRPPRWGVSSLDYHTHAVEEDAEHSDAVYVARCGQLLFRGVVLYDEPPGGGSMCPPCVREVERGDTGEGTEPPPALGRPGRWARSPLDYHAHLFLPEGDHPGGVLTARCGAVMITGLTRHDQPLPGLTCEPCRLVFLADSDTPGPRDE
ncbi:MAG: hypothetical protein ACRDRI_21835 [Pseudonocardiaceae bacterium]